MTPDELRTLVKEAVPGPWTVTFDGADAPPHNGALLALVALTPDLALQLADAMEEIERAQIDGVVTDEGLFIRPEGSMARLWALLADFHVLQQVIQALREE